MASTYKCVDTRTVGLISKAECSSFTLCTDKRRLSNAFYTSLEQSPYRNYDNIEAHDVSWWARKLCRNATTYERLRIIWRHALHSKIESVLYCSTGGIYRKSPTTTTYIPPNDFSFNVASSNPYDLNSFPIPSNRVNKWDDIIEISSIINTSVDSQRSIHVFRFLCSNFT